MWKRPARAETLSILLCAALAAAPAFAGDLGESLSFNGASQLSLEATTDSAGRIVYDSGPSDAQQDETDTVLFHGEVSGPVEVSASRQAPDGSWGAWTAAFVKRYPDGRFWGKATLARGRGSVRLRARSSDGQPRS